MHLQYGIFNNFLQPFSIETGCLVMHEDIGLKWPGSVGGIYLLKY